MFTVLHDCFSISLLHYSYRWRLKTGIGSRCSSLFSFVAVLCCLVVVVEVAFDSSAVVFGRGEGRSFMVSSSRTGTEYCCCFTEHRIFNQEYRYDIQRMESPSSEHRVPFGWQICNMQQYNVKPITLDTIYRVPSTLLSHRSSPSLIVHSFTSLSKVRKTRYLPIP